MRLQLSTFTPYTIVNSPSPYVHIAQAHTAFTKFDNY